MAMNPRLLRPLATGFDPRRIAGLQLWLDAGDPSTLTMNGSTVSEWRDKSGFNRHAAQTDAVRQPGLASGGLSFGSTNIALLGGTAGWLASEFTLCYAADVASYPNFPRLFSQRFVAGAPDWNSTPAFIPLVGNISQGGGRVGPSTGASGLVQALGQGAPRPCVFTVTKAAGASGALAVWHNGTVNVTGTALSDTGNLTALQYSIGAELTSAGALAASSGFTGTVWSAIAYSRLLSNDEITRLNRFLGRRFNITVA